MNYYIWKEWVFRVVHYSDIADYSTLFLSVRSIYSIPANVLCIKTLALKTVVTINGYRWRAGTWCEFSNPDSPDTRCVGVVRRSYKLQFPNVSVWAVQLSACPILEYSNTIPVVQPLLLQQRYTLHYSALRYICHLTTEN